MQRRSPWDARRQQRRDCRKPLTPGHLVYTSTVRVVRKHHDPDPIPDTVRINGVRPHASACTACVSLVSTTGVGMKLVKYWIRHLSSIRTAIRTVRGASHRFKTPTNGASQNHHKMTIEVAEAVSLSAERRTFEKAKTYLKPTFSFRCVTQLYAERKLLIVLVVHFVATCIVWSK